MASAAGRPIGLLCPIPRLVSGLVGIWLLVTGLASVLNMQKTGGSAGGHRAWSGLQ